MEENDPNSNNNHYHDNQSKKAEDTPGDHTDSVDISWSMFESIRHLGGGAYGDVYKVKCLQSTKVCAKGGERVKMRHASVKQTKAHAIKQRVA